MDINTLLNEVKNMNSADEQSKLALEIKLEQFKQKEQQTETIFTEEHIVKLEDDSDILKQILKNLQ